MKGKDFARLLTDFADVLRDVGAREHEAASRSVVSIFEVAPESKVSAICSVLSGVQPLEHGNGLRLQEMVSLLASLKGLLKGASAKKQVLDDVERVAVTLALSEQAPTTTFADAAILRLREHAAQGNQPVHEEIVKHYVELLEEALNDEARFALVFDQLKSDPSIKLAEAKKVAKAFAKETAKSKTAAFDLIWARHTALMGSRARQQANTGRTAA